MRSDQPAVRLARVQPGRVEVLVQDVVRAIARRLHLGLQFVEAKQVGHVRLSRVGLDLDQFVRAGLRRQRSAIGVVRQHRVGVTILRVGAQRSALLGLVRRA